MRDEIYSRGRNFTLTFQSLEISCKAWCHGGFCYIDGVLEHRGKTRKFEEMMEFDRATGECNLGSAFTYYLEKTPPNAAGKAANLAGGILGFIMRFMFGLIGWVFDVIGIALVAAFISPMTSLFMLAFLGSVGIAIYKSIPDEAPLVLLGLGALMLFGYMCRKTKEDEIKADLDKLIIDAGYYVSEYMDLESSDNALDLEREMKKAPDQTTVCVPLKRMRHVDGLKFACQTTTDLLFVVNLVDARLLPDAPRELVTEMEAVIDRFIAEGGIMLRPPLMSVSGHELTARIQNSKCPLSNRLIAMGYAMPPGLINFHDAYGDDTEPREAHFECLEHAQLGKKGIWSEQYSAWRRRVDA